MIKIKTITKWPIFLLLILLSTVVSNAQKFDKFLSCANNGDTEAMYNVACCYIGGKDVAQNVNLGMFWLKKSADEGFAPAQAWMSLYYRTGLNNTQIDNNKSFKYAVRSSTRNNNMGHYMLAICYRDGIGCMPTKSQYLHYLEKAAQMNEDDAQVELGSLYLFGSEQYNIKADKQLAFALFYSAYKQENTDAMFMLGVVYENGDGVSQNIYTAIMYYKKAAENGNIYSMRRLYNLYSQKDGPISQNKTEALKYIKMGVETGDPSMLYSMGYEYCMGELLPSYDNDLAIQYWERSAELGYMFAHAALGVTYYRGDSPAKGKNYERAFRHLKYAADAHEDIDQELLADVYRCLGACYRFGRGTDKNINKADHYTSLAAKLGNEESKVAMKYMGR